MKKRMRKKKWGKIKEKIRRTKSNNERMNEIDKKKQWKKNREG